MSNKGNNMDTWYYRNIQKAKAYQKEYRDNNRHIFTSKDATYRANKVNAEPKWLDIEMRKKITDIYKKCRWTSLETEVSHSVDHIIPLNGNGVCGLHVPWNLMIVTSSFNSTKSNNIIFEKYPKMTYTCISENNKKGKVLYTRKVIRLVDGKVFNSLSLAAKEEDCSVSTMSQVCSGERHSIHRNFYKYYNEVDDVEKELEKKIVEYLSNKKTKKRVMCIEDGIVFETAADAANHYKVTYKTIGIKCKTGKPLINKHFKYTI